MDRQELDNASVTSPTITPRRRWYQFSLRSLFVLTTVSAVLLAYETHRVRQQKQALATVRELGGSVFYNYDAPFGLHRVIDDDYLSRVVGIDLSFSATTDADIERLKVDLRRLKSLVWVRLTGSQVSPDGAIVLQNSLGEVGIWYTSGNLKNVPPRFNQRSNEIPMIWPGEEPLRP